MKSIDKARNLLKQLFRTKNADLDFGIYRIMNFKRAEIEKFISKDLIEAAEAEFKEFARVGAIELEKALEKHKREINDFVPGTIGEDWGILKNHDLPKVKEFLVVLEEYWVASVSEEQVQYVFNHVYEFFSRYYEDGDFIPRTRYGGRDKYFVPYNGEEVLLHWATKDMYYVKTGEYFNKYSFRAGGFKVTFKLVKAQLAQGNVKGEKKYFILQDEDPVSFDEASAEVEIRFNYKTLTDEENERYGRRRRSKIQEDFIDKALTKIEAFLGVNSLSGVLNVRGDDEKSLMRKHLDAYIQRNTKDFFIHKDLKGFLLKEFEFYLKNEVWDLNVLEKAPESQAKLMMAKAKAIRGISTRIIEFLAQIEEFQKRLFEKKKFILRTDYCITLDLIPEEYYEEIGQNEKQVLEWKNLYYLDEITKGTLYNIEHKNILSSDFLKSYKHLVLDTQYFNEEFKNTLLSRYNDLDNFIGGIIIKSENWQALNLIQSRYYGLVKCIYIDPPYNTGIDGFNYKDKYQHSSWMSMIYDRMLMGSFLLKDEGTLNVSIDDNEVHSLKILLDNIYNPINFLQKIMWKKRGGPPNDKIIGDIHEYIMVYSKNNEKVVIYPKERSEKQLKRYKNPDNHPKGRWAPDNLMSNVKGGRYVESLYYPIINQNTGEEHYPSSHGNWRFNKEKIEQLLENSEIYFGKNGKGRPKLKRFLCDVKKGVPYPSIWDHLPYNNAATKEIENYFGDVNKYDTPKPVELMKEILKLNTNINDLIIDYFAGSGSMADAVLNLNKEDGGKRKYILVEMGNFFDDVTKQRIQKIMFSKEWKLGKPQNLNGISHIFKYQFLEQYEDTLNNIEFIQSDSSIQSRLDRLPDYFLTYILDYETKESPTRIYFEQFKTPFNYRIKTISGGEEIEEPVDLVETFNYLLGLHVDCLRTFNDGDRLYKVVYGTLGNEQVVVIWRDTPDLDLKRDKEFIENTILSEIAPDTVYLNGDSYLEKTTPIEPEFKKIMGA